MNEKNPANQDNNKEADQPNEQPTPSQAEGELEPGGQSQPKTTPSQAEGEESAAGAE